MTQPRSIESHPTVYHGVATIEGLLRPEVTFVDLLRATFPGGSITGAPKVRAMEIIEELEPTHRGPYCGAVGYIAADGSMEFNVAIRTMIVCDGLVHMSVGGGIVADSNPIAEYEETLVKARAMFAAVGVDERMIRAMERSCLRAESQRQRGHFANCCFACSAASSVFESAFRRGRSGFRSRNRRGVFAGEYRGTQTLRDRSGQPEIRGGTRWLLPAWKASARALATAGRYRSRLQAA